MRFLDDLYRKPVAVPDAVRPGILTSGIARCPSCRPAFLHDCRRADSTLFSHSSALRHH